MTVAYYKTLENINIASEAEWRTGNKKEQESLSSFLILRLADPAGIRAVSHRLQTFWPYDSPHIFWGGGGGDR